MKHGEIVAVSWPYSDLSGTKVRPAVVVQANYLNGLIDDTILVKITGRRYGIPGTEVVLDPADEPAAGLTKVCCAACNYLLTRDQGLIGPVIGYLSGPAMQRIADCLMQVLALP